MFFYAALIGVIALFAVWDGGSFFTAVEALPIWLRSGLSIVLLGLVPALLIIVGGIVDMMMDKSGGNP